MSRKVWDLIRLVTDLPSSFPNHNKLGVSKKPSEASQYLPGGQKYQQSLADSAKNPRGGLPVSQWISNWDETYAQPTC